MKAYDFLEYIQDNSYKNYSVEQKNVISKAIYQFDGFVAGGSVLSFFHHIRNKTLESKKHIKRPFSDIDIFFPKEENLINFVTSLTKNINQNNSQIMMTPSLLNFAINVYDKKEKNLFRANKTQLVQKIFGTPESIINDFDFRNCKLFISKNDCYFPDELVKLEEEDCLDINKYQGLTSVVRCGKYFNEKKYKYLTDNYKKEVSEQIQVLFDTMVQSDKPADEKYKYKLYDKKDSIFSLMRKHKSLLQMILNKDAQNMYNSLQEEHLIEIGYWAALAKISNRDVNSSLFQLEKERILKSLSLCKT